MTQRRILLSILVYTTQIYIVVARFFPCQLLNEETPVYFNSTTGSFTASVIPGQNPNSAKKCACFNSEQYCLQTHKENFCSVSRRCYSCDPDPDEAILCYRQNSMSSFSLFLWNPSLIMFFLVFVCFFATSFGRQARNYVLRRCFPCINTRIVESILRREAIIRQAVRERYEQRSTRPDGMRQKVRLQLKTRKINQKDLNMGEITCSICMNEFELHEKVGDLNCNHLFHCECLKTWVLWRNACPLCNESNIAAPQRYLEQALSIDESFEDNDITEINSEERTNPVLRIFSVFRRRN
jgi:hypothetical protein